MPRRDQAASFTARQPAAITGELSLGTYDAAAMIDNFALGLSHGLMLLAAFLLLRRGDLDDETPSADTPRKPAKPAEPIKRRFGWRA